MKATLLALITLGSLAMAAGEPQPLTIIPSVKGVGGGDYDTIVFTLTNNGTRTTVLGGEQLTSTVTLDSIQLAGRDIQKTDTLANWCPVITDANGTVVGFSMTPSTTAAISHKTDWGWDYQRSYCTLTDIANADMSGEALTLNLGKEYRLYLGTQDQAFTLYQMLYGAAILGGDPVVISTEYYTPKAIKVTTAGQYDESSAYEYGLMNNGSIMGPTWAPLMGIIVVNSNVPEPATGTLSLLALAGLCIRRRK